MTLTDQKKQALELYVNQSFTQQQIANALGVCVRTVHNWVKQHAWDRLRLATHQAPALIADNFSSQLVELQNNIAAREPGKRFPTTQEMEIMRKLTVCIANTKKTVSLPQVTQMMRMFRSFVFDNRSKPYAQGVADVIDAFLEARSRFGYSPYELEFGVEKIQHIDPLCSPYVDTIAKETTEPVFSRFFDPEELTPEPNPKIHTVDTSKWSDKMRNAMMSHFGDFDTTNTSNPEDQAIHASIVEKIKPILENEIPLIINELSTKTHENTGNESAKPETFLEGLRKAFLQNQPQHPNDDKPQTHENTGKIPEKPETFLEGLRKAFLQNQPQYPDNVLDPNTTSNTVPLLENEIALTINELDAKTHENIGNKPANPATQETPKQPNDNLIRQGEVFSRPVYITPTWPFREEPVGNKYKY